MQEAIKATGMTLNRHEDLTHHLTTYFKRMLSVVKESRLPMMLKGVPVSRLDAYEEVCRRNHTCNNTCIPLV